MSEHKTQINLVSILGLLGVAFIILKLTKTGVVANWSWWWVLAPFWIPTVIAIIFLILLLLFLIILDNY